MSLVLPEDLTRHIPNTPTNTPGAYALQLHRPTNIEERWHRHNDHKPPYWDRFITADRVYYVGGTNNLISRLEDHRDNERPDRREKRSTALTKVCDIVGLQAVWPHDGDVQHVFDVLEPRLGRWLQAAKPGAYVHYR